MLQDMKHPLVEEFAGTLADVLEGTARNAEEILYEISKESDIPSSVVSHLLASESPDLRSLFEDILRSKLDSLAILPVSGYVLEHLEAFRNAFPRLALCDNLKQGQRVLGLEIVDQATLHQSRREVDAYFLASGESSVRKALMPSVDPSRTVCYHEFARRLAHGGSRMVIRPEHLLERIHGADNPLVVLVGLYYPNVYTPMLETLEARGYDLFLLCRQTLSAHAGFTSTVDRVAPFAEKYLLDFHEMLHVIRYLDRGMLWLIAETLFDCSWDGSRSLTAYAYPAALMRMCRRPCILNLYDVIRPLRLNTTQEMDVVLSYKRMLSAASGVVLNSNTSDTADFLARALELKTPITSFFRYNQTAHTLLPKRKDGYHIAMVGIFLGEHEDPARVNMQEYIRLILRQELHLHYYSDHSAVRSFFDGLAPRERRFFHIHASILDQQELMREISQYHAGWMVHRTQAFVDLMSSLQNDFLKDLIYLFHQTTIPTCALLFGCAGLPMFVNRSLQGLPRSFPPAYYLQVELSEIAQLRSIMEQVDWPEIWKQTMGQRHLFSIDNNIGSMLSFLSKVGEAHQSQDRA